MCVVFSGIASHWGMLCSLAFTSPNNTLSPLVQIYYASGLQSAAPARRQVSRSAVEALFQGYADPTEGCIMAEGVGRFCEDLEVRLHLPATRLYPERASLLT